eukprot:TRINITY_DN46551_c0_g1_i1.p1 TRINITY_DN46551_c0_g1~~TRINITY_DN46551_c0_g1_i1.p1  ORF type:complete len:215 (-),score=24.86 TRINITY_DN46551_c0_g1_i1:169-813(-)
MSSCIAGRHHFMASHGGPGARKGHSFTHEDTFAPQRVRSLPSLGIPAGYSNNLGNRLGLQHYADLQATYHAKLGAHPHAPAPRAQQVRTLRSEMVWEAPERLKPELLPPAGGIKPIMRGKRLVPENVNTLSNVDTLIWARDIDGSDGYLPQANKDMYKNAAGADPRHERTPVYGHSPPHCVRTFGEHGSTTWENPRGVTHRLDPRRDFPEFSKC